MMPSVATSEPSTALIAGADIGGLAAGVALRRAGWNVRIYERTARPRELGFGLLLAPNALAALHAAVGDESIRIGCEVTGFTATSDRATIQLTGSRTDTGALLIAADGVASIIRRTLHPNEPPPRPSGYTAIRGVAFGASGALGDLSGIAYLDTGIEAAAMRAATDAVYWYISLRSRDASGASPAEVLESRLPGFDRPFRDIVSSTTVEDMRLDELFRRGPLDAWGAGPVTLLGDAAHPVMPQTGQGAAQALEDAVALGLALRHGSAEDGLRRYERVRSRRTRRFVKLGPRLARLTTTTNPAIIALRTAALRMLPSAALAQPMRALRRDPHGELRGG